MNIRHAYIGLLLGAALGICHPAIAAQGKGDKVAPAADNNAGTSTSLLPGGASALSETHGDWTVNCQATVTTKTCTLSHQQFNKQSGQRLLAIELALPFGLALSNGITLEVDDKKLDGSLQFSTCQMVGCLVPVSFDGDVMPLLKAGTTLKINAVAADTQQPVNFTISLNGFGSALARTAALSGD